MSRYYFSTDSYTCDFLPKSTPPCTVDETAVTMPDFSTTCIANNCWKLYDTNAYFDGDCRICCKDIFNIDCGDHGNYDEIERECICEEGYRTFLVLGENEYCNRKIITPTDPTEYYITLGVILLVLIVLVTIIWKVIKKICCCSSNKKKKDKKKKLKKKQKELKRRKVGKEVDPDCIEIEMPQLVETVLLDAQKTCSNQALKERINNYLAGASTRDLRKAGSIRSISKLGSSKRLSRQPSSARVPVMPRTFSRNHLRTQAKLARDASMRNGHSIGLLGTIEV
eukprot:TRINITY_DN213323_c0_g1_i1.p1 TRINITY_DN213323_c0_g1~~TRINITY_DN213323_c0_g1_i1.p1  ORF type:complete len:282 (+),score=48.95 TRINITY_DN213323_c0_g1_i1:37-882(+)